MLTPQQLTVLRLVALGLTEREIARALCVEKTTVHGHIAKAMARLGARNRAHAMVLGWREMMGYGSIVVTADTRLTTSQLGDTLIAGSCVHCGVTPTALA